jgi:hypothetical protein
MPSSLNTLATFQHAARYWKVISPYAEPTHGAALADGLRKAGMMDEEVILIGGW